MPRVSPTLVFKLLLFVLSVVMLPAHASESSSLAKELIDARKLVYVAPLQSKNVARSFLVNVGVNRDDQDFSINTTKGKLTPIVKASNQVFAYQTLAIAEFTLGNYRSSLSSIDRSITISVNNHLKYKEVESRLIKINLLWVMTEDIQKIETPLTEIEQALSLLGGVGTQKKRLEFKLNLTYARIRSDLAQYELADQYYLAARNQLEELKAPLDNIDLGLKMGQNYLKSDRLNLALKELIESYWQAIDADSAEYIAQSNHLLADLYFKRQMYNKAQEHLSQAASFYGNYENSPVFATVLRKLADVYFIQGRYNLALVHYFNVLDQQLAEKDLEEIIELRLKLSDTYLNLFNYTLADRYLNRATELIDYTDVDSHKVTAKLLRARLDFLQEAPKKAEMLAKEALDLAQNIDDTDLQLKTLDLLHRITRQLNKSEDSLNYLEEYNRLYSVNVKARNELISRAFLNQVASVEQYLHYKDQVNELTVLSSEYDKYKSMTFIFGLSSALLLLLLTLASHRNKNKKQVIGELNKELYTHSRSGLKNMRMLSRKLPDSLAKSGNNYDQWRFGQLIAEPLNDRLKFALLDVPLLGRIYLDHGYKAGRIYEKAFGEHIRQQIPEGARLYHLSDRTFLYIEPNPEKQHQPELMFQRFKSWVDSFEVEFPVNRNFVVSIADYPFLPRAYTAINDEDLIDLLLLSIDIGGRIMHLEQQSQWVSFTAIPMAPAASFAQDNIRRSILSAIKNGLIKVHTSGKEENLNLVLEQLPNISD